MHVLWNDDIYPSLRPFVRVNMKVFTIQILKTNYCSYEETTAISFSWTKKGIHIGLKHPKPLKYLKYLRSFVVWVQCFGVQEFQLWNLWLNQSWVFSLAKKEKTYSADKSHFFMNYKSLGWIVMISADTTPPDAFEQWSFLGPMGGYTAFGYVEYYNELWESLWTNHYHEMGFCKNLFSVAQLREFIWWNKFISWSWDQNLHTLIWQEKLIQSDKLRRIGCPLRHSLTAAVSTQDLPSPTKGELEEEIFKVDPIVKLWVDCGDY